MAYGTPNEAHPPNEHGNARLHATPEKNRKNHMAYRKNYPYGRIFHPPCSFSLERHT